MTKHIYQRIDGTFYEITWVDSDPEPEPQNKSDTLRYNGDAAKIPASLVAEILAAEPSLPNLPGFRSAIASLPQWQAVVGSPQGGLAVELSRCISEGDLKTAAESWWPALVATGLITDDLQSAMLAAAIANNMPSAILSALGFQAQN